MPKPKAGVAKSSTKKAQKPQDDAMEQTLSANTEKKAPKPRRVPMSAGSAADNVPDEAKDPNFYFRWCADYDKGKIQRYQAAGYEFVLDKDGNRIKRPSGDSLYLMRQPMEYREQDLLAKRNKIVETNRKLQKDHSVKKKGSVPDYIPKGNEKSFIETGEAEEAPIDDDV